MFKKLCILLIVIGLCCAEDDLEGTGRKKHKIHHLAHHGVFYYLAFLAIKAKIVFFIGTMIMMVLFGSKFLAVTQYALLNNKKNDEPQKIYIQSPPQSPYYSSPEFYSSHEHEHDHEDYSYARNLGDNIFDNLALFKDIIDKLNLTDTAFDSAKMKETACRERFVCEADFRAKNNEILALGMYIFSDSDLDKYRHNTTQILNFDDCARIYSNCPSLPDDISM